MIWLDITIQYRFRNLAEMGEEKRKKKKITQQGEKEKASNQKGKIFLT